MLLPKKVISSIVKNKLKKNMKKTRLQKDAPFSHAFACKSHSARRTQYLCSMLQKEQKIWYLNVSQKRQYHGMECIIDNNFKDPIIFVGRKLIFSAKDKFLEERLIEKPEGSIVKSILHDTSIRKINTKKGSVCFCNGSLVYILVPRKDALDSNYVKKFIIKMTKLSKKVPVQTNPRGNKNQLLMRIMQGIM